MKFFNLFFFAIFAIMTSSTYSQNIGFVKGIVLYDLNDTTIQKESYTMLDKFISDYYSADDYIDIVFTIGINNLQNENENIGMIRAQNLIRYLRSKYPQFKDRDIYLVLNPQMNKYDLPDNITSGKTVGLMYSTYLPLRTME